jgi:hypothetical protein
MGMTVKAWKWQKGHGNDGGFGNDIRIRWHMKNQQQKIKMKIA